ncbi:MAG: hypothetical protein HZA53_05795 [Planctomycetes bacterium]|nr:hypothetical protein [Planctomycetota bacterium]
MTVARLFVALTLSAFVPQDPTPLAPTPGEAAPVELESTLVWQVGQPAPEFDVEHWASGSTKDGKTERRSSSSSSGGGAEQDALASRMQSMQGDPTLEKLHGLVLVVHRTPSSNAQRWNALVELVDANRDRHAAIVSFAAEEDAQPVQDRLKNEDLPCPVGVLGLESKSIWARDEIAVVGRTGELLCCSTKLDEVAKAFEKALGCCSAERIEHPLAPALLPALADYFGSRYAKARDSAEAMAKKAEAGKIEDAVRVAADAKYLLARIDGQEKELVAACAKALADGSVERLVDLDLVLSKGCKGDVARAASDALKKIQAQSLLVNRVVDYRKYLGLVEQRPLLFPRRDDAAGKKLVKELESFLKQTSNDAASQQRARGLIQRYRARHGFGSGTGGPREHGKPVPPRVGTGAGPRRAPHRNAGLRTARRPWMPRPGAAPRAFSD